MSPDEALQAVASGCARMSGTLYEHQRLQEALTVLGNIVQPPEDETNGSSEVS